MEFVGATQGFSSDGVGAAMDRGERTEGEDGGRGWEAEKDHMFDKVVTPSDVGKLNRLVIPKQHAEKYFPLDSSSNEKGLLLNFEDRGGKSWRFRYSYWNSSQSYVMTKGWSRFVKEKRLDAGDIVSFHRAVGDSIPQPRFFIDWRRRFDAPSFPRGSAISALPHHYYCSMRSPHHPFAPWFFANPAPSTAPAWEHNPNRSAEPSYLWDRAPQPKPQMIDPHHLGMLQLQHRRMPEGMYAISEQQPMVIDSVPLVRGRAAAKPLRLFGVNIPQPSGVSDQAPSMISHNSIYPRLSQELLDSTTTVSPSSSISDPCGFQLGGFFLSSPANLIDKGKRWDA